MISDEIGLMLHHRSAVGKPLTDEEKVDLEAWYALKDAEEKQLFKTHASAEEDIAKLRQQVKFTLEHVSMLAEQLKEAAANNETLRIQNEDLRRKLVKFLDKKAA